MDSPTHAGRIRVDQYLLEALSLPEVCLLEHCDDHRRAVLQGQVSAIARDELDGGREATESSLNSSFSQLDFDSESPLERESCMPTPNECAELPLPPGLGLRRQPSFKPPSMLTDEEQQSIRCRRRACVLQLARSVMGRTASKISKSPRRWHSSGQAESKVARAGKPRVGSPRIFSAPEQQDGRTLGRPSCSLFSSARGKQNHFPANT